jgi:carbon storage regulator
MLILSRKFGEQIVVGDNILITVVAICGNRVKLGITAPRGVPVQREELGPKAADRMPPVQDARTPEVQP